MKLTEPEIIVISQYLIKEDIYRRNGVAFTEQDLNKLTKKNCIRMVRRTRISRKDRFLQHFLEIQA